MDAAFFAAEAERRKKWDAINSGLISKATTASAGLLLGADEAKVRAADVDAYKENDDAKNDPNEENNHVRSGAPSAVLKLGEAPAQVDSNMTDEESDDTPNDENDHVRRDASGPTDSRGGGFTYEPLPQAFVAKKRKLIVVSSVD